MSPKLAHSWERQKNESPRAYGAFRTFKELGSAERSIVNAHKKTGEKHQRTIERWHSRYKWRQRAMDYDEWKSNQVTERQIETGVETRGRWVEQARLMQSVAYQALARRAEQIAGIMAIPVADRTDEDRIYLAGLDLTLNQIRQMLVSGMDAERLSVGEPTEIVRTDSFDQFMADLRLSRGAPAVIAPFDGQQLKAS